MYRIPRIGLPVVYVRETPQGKVMKIQLNEIWFLYNKTFNIKISMLCIIILIYFRFYSPFYGYWFCTFIVLKGCGQQPDESTRTHAVGNEFISTQEFPMKRNIFEMRLEGFWGWIVVVKMHENEKHMAKGEQIMPGSKRLEVLKTIRVQR